MRRCAVVFICSLISLSLMACTGPGTGPGGTYTAADQQRDQTNTAIAVGAAAVGAAVLGTALYNAGKNDAYHAPAQAPVRQAPAPGPRR
jgi:hypothetical protein